MSLFEAPVGRIRRRLALAIVLAALIPVLAAIALVEFTVRQTSARFFVPEIGERLDQSLELYQELARAVKQGMRSQADAMARSPELRDALRDLGETGDEQAVSEALRAELESGSGVVALQVFDELDQEIAAVDRGHPVDDRKEKQLVVEREIRLPGAETEFRLVAKLATDRRRFDQHEQAARFLSTYRKIEARREADERSYVIAFAALLGLTILAAVGLGSLLARGVTKRIGELARATKRVGAGDLSVRVDESGTDEIADFSRAFNNMLAEVEASRARIEYLHRIGAWQEMARRLAHEIKNPLTPIQLAVQEVESRYKGDDARFRSLLATTREIVEDEVGTLRRLVTEFSSFARMPRAELEEGDLADLVRHHGTRLRVGGDAAASSSDEGVSESRVSLGKNAHFELDVPSTPAPAYLDRQMLGRVLTNLIRNAGDAIDETSGHVAVRLGRDQDYWVLDIEDDGPGVPPQHRQTIFDPYVTTKEEGTGLGLAIAKKIVVEHGGSIVAEESPLGGARMRIKLPVLGTPAAAAALDASHYEPPPSRRTPSESLLTENDQTALPSP